MRYKILHLLFYIFVCIFFMLLFEFVFKLPIADFMSGMLLGGIIVYIHMFFMKD